MPKPPDYGIIYNWDGAPHGYSQYPQTMQQFLEKTYSVMSDTQVGAHFWNVGSDLGDLRDSSEQIRPRSYSSAYELTSTENKFAMFERGEDPYASLIDRGHKLGLHVYASIRMNDNHFSGMQPNEMEHSNHPSLTTFRRDHPEYLLGDRVNEWFAVSYDFASTEVRRRRIASITELCERYDWDGVELDWQRHAFHFDEDYGYRMRYLLTDVQRMIRRLTDGIAEKRGKPFYLAARVNGYIDECAQIGYDIPDWIKNGLVDILIPAGGAGTETAAEVSKFKDLCLGTEIAIYPGFDSSIPGVGAGPEDAFTKDQMMTRALATGHHLNGATGIYVFNWHADGQTRRELLTTIGSTDTLRGKDKIYAATRRHLVYEGSWRGAFHKDRIWGTVPVPIKTTFSGGGPTVEIQVADDVKEDRKSIIELRIRLENWLNGDVIRVLWNGVEVSDIDQCHVNMNDPHANPFESPVSDVTDTIWLSTNLDHSMVNVGCHRVELELVERNPLIETDIILTDVELAIRYIS